ncbi:MAG: DUF1674 domain-containing protein [Woeseiaceae bacterium]|nr:DUF1674 domain-containing protein [Woeseiaceae bacterium]
MNDDQPDNKAVTTDDKVADDTQDPADMPPEEIGGRDGPDPTRYGDWEKNGRCIDF